MITTDGQDTLKIDTLKKDTLLLHYDSMKVQEDCHDIMIEQRSMNNQLKNQLDILKNIVEKEKNKDEDE